MLLNPKTPLVFGIIATAALSGYLFVRHPIPDSLSRAHAQFIPGTDIYSCKECHTEDGLKAGCLSCHTEIAGQLDTKQGYHAFLARNEGFDCGVCHPEHHGKSFPLVSSLSWPGGDPNAFDHPHCLYELDGRHDRIACSDCHVDKLTQVFSLPRFSQYPRASTFLGLNQDCLACHVDVHAWPSEKACLDCHDQNAFDPASAFQHDNVFVLEGVHADINCSDCHPIPSIDRMEAATKQRTPGSIPYHKVNGKTCEECHTNPHHTVWNAGCENCHLGRDAKWSDGLRGIDTKSHETTSFSLTDAHVTVACQECHANDADYNQRYPDPRADGYQRQLQNCQGCHEDIHAGKLKQTCTTCHQISGWHDKHLLFEHDRDTTFVLDAVHKNLTCQECHAEGDLTYRAEGTECTECHKEQYNALRGRTKSLQVDPDPHFDRIACTDCHDMNFPRQSLVRYARRCADCHNDQYTQLAFQWARTLEKRRSEIERLAGKDNVASEQTREDLSEAAECGFHHLQLTRQLYDRLLQIVQEEETGKRTSQKENAVWTGH